MDILQQCQIWHENGEYQKIVDALEAIPEEERTPETDSELARAYNNTAALEDEDKELFRKAIALLKPHEEYFEGDHYWNFRMGYAYFYLDREEIALGYFKKALGILPDDEDTKELIDYCNKSLMAPLFEKNFCQRTKEAWEVFAEHEEELRRFMDEDKKHERGDELTRMCDDILSIAFDDVSFEMGFNGEKHELILTPEGDKVKLFQLVYFRCHAPEAILEHWSILVGRPAISDFGLRFGDWDISAEDVQVWIEQEEDGDIGLSAYCEKLSNASREEEGKVYWALATLTDQVIGEIANMKYIEDLEVIDTPMTEPSFLLSELPQRLKEMGKELPVNVEDFLENSYTGYRFKPDEDPDADWRMDIMAGSTNCVPIISDYLSGDCYYMDRLHADGAVAGFICYPLDGFTGENRSQQIFDFREKVEDMIIDECGDAAVFIGGATGIYSSYVDFIAWDLKAVLDTAKRFFENTDIPCAAFHVFRRDCGMVLLKKETELPDDLDCIPFKPENADAFYKQIEQWNDEDEYTLCVKALETISPDLWDYRAAYAMARALENYAIIGDHNEGTPRFKGDNALNRAIEVLEQVGEEGRDKAEWNMRMAYAYQYLYGQEEKAIPYAQRWAELDPDDENALAVVNECKKEIADRSKEKSEDEEGNSDRKGAFTGFVLLSKAKWDKQQFIRDMKEKWDITVEEDDDSEDKRDDTVVFEVGDMLAAVSLMNYPIPNGEAEINAENNYMWQGAVEAAKQHCAHIMVAVMRKGQNLLERGKLYTKIVAACCRQKYATGVYTSGVVFEPQYYEGFAEMMKEDELPIFNWIWFGLYRNDGGMCAYTYGMDVFGKEEMEVLNADAEPEELRDFLSSLVSYVLEYDEELLDGETIGFSDEDKHAITRSKGVSLPEEQMTLKISYDTLGDS